MLASVISPLFKVLSRGKLQVFLFHKVPRAANPLTPNELDLPTFERVLAAASRRFKILPLNEAVQALRAGNLPSNAACITFDDGYTDWLPGVIPILEDYNAHATFFITTGQFSGLPMWNERILHAVSNALPHLKELVVEGLPTGSLLLQSLPERIATIQTLDRHLKYLPLTQREIYLQALEYEAGVQIGDVPVMSASDLRTIHSKGFGIGSHTVGHPILTSCNAEVALREIVNAKEQLESLIGGAVTAFAYPNGIPRKDFAAEHIELVKKAGYEYAVTTHLGTADTQTPIYQIPRFTPWGPTRSRMDLQTARNLVLRPLVVPEVRSLDCKILMVAFHFPPQSGSSGILRTLNFVKFLPKFGLAPIVLTAQPRAYENTNNDLISSIPGNTVVIRSFAMDAARHLAIWGKFPRSIALPDRWASWWPSGVFAGLKAIRTLQPEVIWSTYPIATSHLIAATISRISGLPWIADFRDPMVTLEYPSDKLQRWIWRLLEAYVFRNANQIVFTTPAAARQYQKVYPKYASKITVVENGYDEEAFYNLKPNRFGAGEDKIFMLHSGLIYPMDRDPSPFFEAISLMLEEGTLDRRKLCIRFRAAKHEQEIREAANKVGLSDVIDIASPVGYSDALSEMLATDLLLVFQGSKFNRQIPAKIYEYLRAQRPILALVDLAGDTAVRLREYDHVSIAAIDNPAEIKLTAEKWVLTKKQPEARDFSKNLDNVKKFNREQQTGVMAGLVSGIRLRRNAASEKVGEPSDHETELRKKLISGAKWATLVRVASQAFSWVVTLAMVRLLSPQDYGLNAMIEVPIELLMLFSTLGVDAALIRYGNRDAKQLSSTFGLLLLVNSLFFLFLISTAAWVADYFREPRLTDLIRVTAVVFILAPFRTIPNALLDMDLDFKLKSQVELAASIFASSTALCLAWFGAGVWALVAAILLNAILRAVLLALYRPWIIRPAFTMEPIQELLKYGIVIVASGAVSVIAVRALNILAGPLLGPEILGFFTVALVFAMLPLSKVMPIVQQTMFPAFAQLKGQTEHSKKYLLKSLELTSLIIYPLSIGMSCISEHLVGQVFGAKWDAIMWPLAILSAITPVRLVNQIFHAPLNATGHAKVVMGIQLMSLLILAGGAVFAAQRGLMGLVYLSCLSAVIGMLVGVAAGRRVFQISLSDLINALKPAIVGSSVMALVLMSTKVMFPNLPGLVRLLLEISIGGAVYLLTMRFLFKSRFDEIKKQLLGS